MEGLQHFSKFMRLASGAYKGVHQKQGKQSEWDLQYTGVH